MQRPRSVRLVAIDGPGGSGKSTFASRLSAAAGDAPVIHTDDFASADNPINWWPRLLEQVITPLANGEPAHYQRYDWPSESLAEWHTVAPVPIIIIEGVSSARSEWSNHLSFVIWIETPREVASLAQLSATEKMLSTTGSPGWVRRTLTMNETRLGNDQTSSSMAQAAIPSTDSPGLNITVPVPMPHLCPVDPDLGHSTTSLHSVQYVEHYRRQFTRYRAAADSSDPGLRATFQLRPCDRRRL